MPRSEEIYMSKTFYEVVFEGNYHTIYGMLEGYLMGAGKSWPYYFSRKVNVKRETFSEMIKEWVTMGNKLHHVIIEEEFLSGLKSALQKQGDSKHFGVKYIKSERKIRNASFRFEFKAYARKFADEIKAIVNNLPPGLALGDYKPEETEDKNAKGVELYSPEHEFTFKGSGKVSGEVPGLIDTWKKFEEHPLIHPESIDIVWE
jgi:hypothetical protein